MVQIPAEFPGGLPAWAKYLERNLNRDLPVDNGAPPGKYTVIVSFIVDKNGGISEVQAENDPGYGTKEEAVRVIKKGPSWKPAVQNGRNVIYRHRQSITFMVSEEEFDTHVSVKSHRISVAFCFHSISCTFDKILSKWQVM